MRNAYSTVAVILPVALGFGLIYQYVMGRLTAFAVFAIVAAMAVLIVGVPALVRSMRDDSARREPYDSSDVLR